MKRASGQQTRAVPHAPASSLAVLVARRIRGALAVKIVWRRQSGEVPCRQVEARAAPLDSRVKLAQASLVLALRQPCQASGHSLGKHQQQCAARWRHTDLGVPAPGEMRANQRDGASLWHASHSKRHPTWESKAKGSQHHFDRLPGGAAKRVPGKQHTGGIVSVGAAGAGGAAGTSTSCSTFSSAASSALRCCLPRSAAAARACVATMRRDA